MSAPSRAYASAMAATQLRIDSKISKGKLSGLIVCTGISLSTGTVAYLFQCRCQLPLLVPPGDQQEYVFFLSFFDRSMTVKSLGESCTSSRVLCVPCPSAFHCLCRRCQVTLQILLCTLYPCQGSRRVAGAYAAWLMTRLLLLREDWLLQAIDVCIRTSNLSARCPGMPAVYWRRSSYNPQKAPKTVKSHIRESYVSIFEIFLGRHMPGRMELLGPTRSNSLGRWRETAEIGRSRARQSRDIFQCLHDLNTQGGRL